MGRLLIVGCVGIALSGCSPSGSGNGSEPVNGATASEAGGQMASSIESGADGFRRTNEPGPGFAVAVGGTGGDGDFLPPECLQLAPGAVWTDVDGDGLPSPQVQVDISCSLPTVVASGRLLFEDLSPAIPGFDAAFAYEDLDILVTATDGKFHIIGNASELNNGTVIGDATFELTHHEDQDTTTEFLTLDDTLGGRIEEEYVWDMVLTATGFQPGNDAPAGSLDVNGSWAVRVQNFYEDLDQSAGTTVTTTVPLGLDPACPTNIVSGSVTATFEGEDGDAEINVTWTGCGTHTANFTASSGT